MQPVAIEHDGFRRDQQRRLIAGDMKLDGAVGAWGHRTPSPILGSSRSQTVGSKSASSLTVNDHDLALRAGLDGIGIVQLPEASVSALVSEGKLVPLLSEWSPWWAGFFLFYSSRRHVPVKLRALVDFLRKESKQAAGH